MQDQVMQDQIKMGIFDKLKLGKITLEEGKKIRGVGIKKYAEHIITDLDTYGELTEERINLLKIAASKCAEFPSSCPIEVTMKDTMANMKNMTKDAKDSNSGLYKFNEIFSSIGVIGMGLRYAKVTGKKYEHLDPDTQFDKLEEKLKSL